MKLMLIPLFAILGACAAPGKARVVSAFGSIQEEWRSPKVGPVMIGFPTDQKLFWWKCDGCNGGTKDMPVFRECGQSYPCEVAKTAEEKTACAALEAN